MNESKSEKLYQNLVETLDELVFFKELSRAIKSEVSCDIIKTSIPVGKDQARLVYSNKNHSRIGKNFPLAGVACHVNRSKRAYFSNSIERDPVFMGHITPEITSELCFPVVSEGEIMAVVQLKRMEKSGPFSKADIDSINEALVGLEKPLTNLKIFIAAKSLNEALLKKIEEKELSQKQNVNVDESLIIEKPIIVGKSEVLKEAVELADKVASQDVNVLISGGTGTGKEVLARRIHTSSKHALKAFAVVDCGCSDQIHISDMLFGDGKEIVGVTEKVKQGTIVIKKVDRLALPLQSRLLSFLRGVRASKLRIITTTSENISEKIANGEFREDLFYFLNTIEIKTPSLIDRTEDIELLVNYYLNFGKELNDQKSFSPGALSCLKNYSWPGNILELQSVVERAFILTDTSIVERIHLSDAINQEKVEEPVEEKEEDYQFLQMPLDQLEKFHICQTLNFLGGNKTKTAKTLGITVKTLYNKLHSYGMIGERDA